MLNVRDNITLPLELDGKAVDDGVLTDILKTLGIEEKEFYYPGQLSRGQMQRAAIARALITNPAILLADEPTGNLDPVTSEKVFTELLTLVRETGLSALIATHNPELAAKMDRRVQLVNGLLEEV